MTRLPTPPRHREADEDPSVANHRGSPTRAPQVSVVIPVKNDAMELECCLEALHRQTLPPDEIVIVDNNSSDLTPQVAKWWGAKLVRESTQGIPAAASTGYDASSGEIIARLDADSVPSTGWVERVNDAFVSDPSLDALTGPGMFPSLPPVLRHTVDKLYMDAYFSVFGWLAGHPPVFGSNFAMRRRVWLEVGPSTHRFDSEVHDDLDLSLCLARLARVRLDHDLRVAVSARPFTDPVAFGRRIRRGVHTVAVNRGR